MKRLTSTFRCISCYKKLSGQCTKATLAEESAIYPQVREFLQPLLQLPGSPPEVHRIESLFDASRLENTFLLPWAKMLYSHHADYSLEKFDHPCE